MVKSIGTFVGILIAVAVLLVGSGCVSLTETAELKDGSKTRTRGLSFWSDTGVPLANSQKSLKSTKYTRSTIVEGLDTDAKTQDAVSVVREAFAGLGAGLAGNPNIVAQQPPTPVVRSPPVLPAAQPGRFTEEETAQLRAILDAANRNGDAPVRPEE